MADDKLLRRTYKYQIYPTVRLRHALEAQLSFACQLYNAALEERRYAWRGRRRSVTLYEQFRELTAVRAAKMGPPDMNCSAMRDPLRRLDRAFAAFFRRVKAGVKPGHPRFRSVRRYDRAAKSLLRVAQRRVARRHKGSHRRHKTLLLLAREHERIRNLRHDHAHKVTRRLVSDFGLVAVEDLNVTGLARGPLAKDVSDQGWAAFLTMLEYKAEEAGTQLIKVPPHGTSKTCSDCGVVVPKLLSERTHRCRMWARA